MRKAVVIAVLTTILVLLGGGLSYATPAREISTTAVREDNSPNKALAQVITELKTSGVPHETVYHTDGIKTTFRFEQGFSFTFVEPASSPVISAFIGGGWDWGKGPYIV